MTKSSKSESANFRTTEIIKATIFISRVKLKEIDFLESFTADFTETIMRYSEAT